MSFDHLATVELQLVMHCCDLLSWLRLARCSRCTLQAAAQPFARRHLRAMRVHFCHPWPRVTAPPPPACTWSASARQLLSPLWSAWLLARSVLEPWLPQQQHLTPVEQVQRSSLLHDCPLAISWTGGRNANGPSTAVTRASVDALLALGQCHVSELLIDHTVLTLEWPRLSEATALLHRLRVLSLPADAFVSDQLMRALLEHAPLPHTLRIDPNRVRFTNRVLTVLTGVGTLPSLTSLRESCGLEQLEPISECTQLQRLELQPRDLSQLVELLLHPNLQSLRVLVLLRCFSIQGEKRDLLAWSAILGNLRSLHTLHLLVGEYISLLRQLTYHPYPSLRLLVICDHGVTRPHPHREASDVIQEHGFMRNALTMQPLLRMVVRVSERRCLDMGLEHWVLRLTPAQRKRFRWAINAEGEQ